MPETYDRTDGAAPTGEKPEVMDADTYQAAIRARFDDASDFIDLNGAGHACGFYPSADRNVPLLQAVSRRGAQFHSRTA